MKIDKAKAHEDYKAIWAEFEPLIIHECRQVYSNLPKGFIEFTDVLQEARIEIWKYRVKILAADNPGAYIRRILQRNVLRAAARLLPDVPEGGFISLEAAEQLEGKPLPAYDPIRHFPGTRKATRRACKRPKTKIEHRGWKYHGFLSEGKAPELIDRFVDSKESPGLTMLRTYPQFNYFNERMLHGKLQADRDFGGKEISRTGAEINHMLGYRDKTDRLEELRQNELA